MSSGLVCSDKQCRWGPAAREPAERGKDGDKHLAGHLHRRLQYAAYDYIPGLPALLCQHQPMVGALSDHQALTLGARADFHGTAGRGMCAGTPERTGAVSSISAVATAPMTPLAIRYQTNASGLPVT